MIIRARVVITMDGPPIENGAVAVSGDRIADVGKFPEISARHAGEEIVDLAVEKLKVAKHWGLAPHAPFTASEKLYRRCEEAANEDFLRLATHLAESREEMSMFRDASGPLFQFMQEIARPMEDCGHETSLAHFTRHVDTEEPWLIAHLNELAESDFDLLLRAKPNFHIIHCPRSHEYFGHSSFQFEKLCQLGFNICLGTDSLASNDGLNLFAEMHAFRKA